MTYVVGEYDTEGFPHRKEGLWCKDLRVFGRAQIRGEIIGIRGASFAFLDYLADRRDEGMKISDPYILAMLDECGV